MSRAPSFSWVGRLVLASSISIGLVACSGGGSSTTSTPATPPTVGITKIVMDTAKSEKSTFGGTTFGTNGSVGTYDKIRGTAYGLIDPDAKDIGQVGIRVRINGKQGLISGR